MGMCAISDQRYVVPYLLALAVFTRSPAAHEALESFKLLQLPSVRTLKHYIDASLEGLGNCMKREEIEETLSSDVGTKKGRYTWYMYVRRDRFSKVCVVHIHVICSDNMFTCTLIH